MWWYVLAFAIYIAISMALDLVITNGVIGMLSNIAIAAILWGWAGLQKNRKKALDTPPE